MTKGFRSQYEEYPMGQNWDNSSIKMNNFNEMKHTKTNEFHLWRMLATKSFF